LPDAARAIALAKADIETAAATPAAASSVVNTTSLRPLDVPDPVNPYLVERGAILDCNSCMPLLYTWHRWSLDETFNCDCGFHYSRSSTPDPCQNAMSQMLNMYGTVHQGSCLRCVTPEVEQQWEQDAKNEAATMRDMGCPLKRR
jgi:hypothetical protein